MRYYSSKGTLFVVIIGFMAVMFALSIRDKTVVAPVLIAAVICYLFWMWFDTWYQIDDGRLFYRSALFKGSVEISTIFQVIINTSQYSGIKASLSTRGMVIKYNKWDDIYISPKEADQFLRELKTINPQIEVIG